MPLGGAAIWAMAAPASKHSKAAATNRTVSLPLLNPKLPLNGLHRHHEGEDATDVSNLQPKQTGRPEFVLRARSALLDVTQTFYGHAISPQSARSSSAMRWSTD